MEFDPDRGNSYMFRGVIAIYLLTGKNKFGKGKEEVGKKNLVFGWWCGGGLFIV
jgi:hypothetical protein